MLRKNDTDYFNNLARVMKYIQGAIGLLLTLSIDKYGNIKWYTYEAFAVHKDMRINTSGFMTMGTGGAYVHYGKQKLNTRSLTEVDIFRVDGVQTQVIWTQYFLKEQGYDINDNVIYQDNQSATKLKNNSRKSSIKRTTRINIRYYFITDRITNQEASM